MSSKKPEAPRGKAQIGTEAKVAASPAAGRPADVRTLFVDLITGP